MITYLTELKNAGIDVNWFTLLLGLEGPGKHAPLLELRDVEAFATEQLDTSPGSGDAATAVLVATEGGLEETRTVLRKLAQAENRNSEQELRKWRFVLLQQALVALPLDLLYGLLTLTEFWERFDYPPDSPHVVQGRDNRMSPPDYFSEENYRASIQRHREWLAAEATALRCPIL
jgi:hypothetical protein